MPAGNSIAQLVFVKLLRKWSAARASGENPVPHMQALALPFGPSPELAPACASLFDLVEGHLGRALTPECCCSQALSRDEGALIGLLLHARDLGAPLTDPAIPHGLPGAVRWAAFAVSRALRATFGQEPEHEPEAMEPAGCPFGPAPDPAPLAAHALH